MLSHVKPIIIGWQLVSSNLFDSRPKTKIKVFLSLKHIAEGGMTTWSKVVVLKNKCCSVFNCNISIDSQVDNLCNDSGHCKIFLIRLFEEQIKSIKSGRTSICRFITSIYNENCYQPMTDNSKLMQQCTQHPDQIWKMLWFISLSITMLKDQIELVPNIKNQLHM